MTELFKSVQDQILPDLIRFFEFASYAEEKDLIKAAKEVHDDAFEIAAHLHPVVASALMIIENISFHERGFSIPSKKEINELLEKLKKLEEEKNGTKP